MIPCPEQTSGVQCSSCGLCMNTQRLRDQNLTIGFAAHGVRKNIVREIVRTKELVIA